MDALLQGVDFAAARLIVELGAGTGCVTREILRRMRPDARLLAIEVNPALAAACREAIADPRMTLTEGCAGALPEILERHGMERVDAVISSLPLAIMPDDLVDCVLDASRDALRRGGCFAQYQYSLADQDRLARRYGRVDVAFTLLNVPPAFVYRCSSPGKRVSGPVRPRRTLAGFYAAALSGAALAIRTVQQFWV